MTLSSSSFSPVSSRSLCGLYSLVCCLVVALMSPVALAAPESVNINSADAQTIADVLDGVGLSRAEAIVDYRDRNGAFQDEYDLANVKGIGERTVEINEDRIRLSD